MRAPPLAVQRPGHAEDERRAVAGEQAAGRPQDHLVLEKGDAELDQRADREADEDLGDREAEVEDCLAQGLQGEQDGGDVQAWVAEAGQQHRVDAPEKPQAGLAPRGARGLRGGGRGGTSFAGGRHVSVTAMLCMPLQKASFMPRGSLFLLAGAVLALSACDLPFGIGSPTTRALESGAAASLQQLSFEITGVYTQTVVAPPPPIVSGARVSAPAVGSRWSLDLQLSSRPPGGRRMSVSNGDVKLDAIVLPSVAYFSGQAFLLQFLGGDPRSRDLARAAGNGWWK